MTLAVVPFKDLDGVKERLASRFSLPARRELVLAMLHDVLGALSRAPGVSGIVVVTREPEVARRAAKFGAQILEEPRNEGHTAAAERAIRELEQRGSASMLCIPGDVPAVTPAEIATILRAQGPSPSVVLVPSRSGLGTNGVLAAPPGALPLRFGEPSFPRHLGCARELGLRTEVLELPGLGLDLDTPDDVDFFLRISSDTATYRLLRGSFER